MEENLIKISELDDFIFCPVSIYFHNLNGNLDTIYYHTEKQINGKHVHNSIDFNKYSTSKDIITSLDVYSSKYGLIGKIDIYDIKNKALIERKKHISTIYDGYIFQLYAQYFCMKEMGYEVNKLKIYSYDDNKTYDINLPEEDSNMYQKYEETIYKIKHFDFDNFIQNNKQKCENCIYEITCNRSLL